jgi:hypothetical protein
MEEISDRGHEEAYDPPAVPSEKAGGPAEEESGLRMSSKIVAVVSASVLAGGGAGMLAGVALGAINPFALGIIGVVLGIGASVPLTSLIVARKAPRRPWWRRLFGAEQKVRLDRNVDEVREEPFRHREVAEGQREHDRIDSEQASRGREANREASKRLQDDVPEGGENDWGRRGAAEASLSTMGGGGARSSMRSRSRGGSWTATPSATPARWTGPTPR